MKTEKFAAIFSTKFPGTIRVETVALVDYDEYNGEFTVKAGEFEESTQKVFDIIDAAPEFIYGNEDEVDIIGSGKDYQIYIFEDDFITDIMERKNMFDEFEAYLYIAEKLDKIKLEQDDEYQYRSIKVKSLAEQDGVDEDAIFEMVYGKQESDDDMDIQVIPISPEEFGKLIGLFSSEMNILEPAKKETPKKEVKREKTKMNVKQIIDEISAAIVGQEDAIRVLVTNIYFNQLLIDSLEAKGEIDENELDSKKISILLDGSTGTGKTAIAKSIAQKLDLPIEIVSANSFSETGYVGPTITDILERLLEKAHGNIRNAERGIVVLDEVDKIAVPANRYEGKDMKKGVQEELLAFISGGMYDTSRGMFDTSKLTFIMSGAFTDLRDKKIKENEAKSKRVGFVKSDEQVERTYTITPQDYVEYGLMREFFGRIKVLTSTKTYTKEDLKRILLESKISPLKNFDDSAQMLGYEGITYDDEFVEDVAQEAENMGTGARGLQTIMSGIQTSMLLDMLSKENKDEPIHLTKGHLKSYEKTKVRRY